MRIALLFALVTCASHGNAQTWLENPVVRVCENIASCDDDRDIELTEKEVGYVEALLAAIPAGSNEGAAASFFGRHADTKTDATALVRSAWKGASYRATWRTQTGDASVLGPHVDIYFIDGRAFMLKWWFNGMKKSVQLTFAR